MVCSEPRLGSSPQCSTTEETWHEVDEDFDQDEWGFWVLTVVLAIQIRFICIQFVSYIIRKKKLIFKMDSHHLNETNLDSLVPESRNSTNLLLMQTSPDSRQQKMGMWIPNMQIQIRVLSEALMPKINNIGNLIIRCFPYLHPFVSLELIRHSTSKKTNDQA